jgi:hypothetical protein
MAGGMYRAPRYYMARNTNPRSQPKDGIRNNFCDRPRRAVHEYWGYRAVMLEHLEADAKCRATYQPQQLRRVFDLVHLKYLAPMLSPGVMDYLIRQSMLPDTTSQQIIEGIWNTFVPPYARPTPGLKQYLADALALLRPRHASRAVKHLRRLGGLYSELKYQGRFDVSLKPSLDT